MQSVKNFRRFSGVNFSIEIAKESPKYMGFTLAEILITLAIIGIIAAMTIPSLLQDSKKLQTQTKLLKITSILNQAILSSYADGNVYNPPGPDVNGNALLLRNYFLPYLKVIKTCEAGEPDCGLLSYWCLHKLDTGLSSLRSHSYRYILSDGTFIEFSGDGGTPYGIVVVDVNGSEGPNIEGYDIFDIIIATTTPPKITMYSVGTVYSTCDNAHTGNGGYCYMRFLLDGNKITYW